MTIFSYAMLENAELEVVSIRSSSAFTMTRINLLVGSFKNYIVLDGNFLYSLYSDKKSYLERN